MGNSGGLKPLEATSYITAVGLEEALRSKRLEPGHKLETRPQGTNKSQKAHEDQSEAAVVEILKERTSG